MIPDHKREKLEEQILREMPDVGFDFKRFLRLDIDDFDPLEGRQLEISVPLKAPKETILNKQPKEYRANICVTTFEVKEIPIEDFFVVGSHYCYKREGYTSLPPILELETEGFVGLVRSVMLECINSIRLTKREFCYIRDYILYFEKECAAWILIKENTTISTNLVWYFEKGHKPIKVYERKGKSISNLEIFNNQLCFRRGLYELMESPSSFISWDIKSEE